MLEKISKQGFKEQIKGSHFLLSLLYIYDYNLLHYSSVIFQATYRSKAVTLALIIIGLKAPYTLMPLNENICMVI